jgi:hypothetical protein
VLPNVAAPISYFVSLEVFDLVEAPSRFGPVATMRHWAVIAMLRMEAIVDSSMEALVAMEPRTNTNERAAHEPFRSVVAIRRAVVGGHVIVTVRTYGRDSNSHGYLGLYIGRDCRQADCDYRS